MGVRAVIRTKPPRRIQSVRTFLVWSSIFVDRDFNHSISVITGAAERQRTHSGCILLPPHTLPEGLRERPIRVRSCESLPPRTATGPARRGIQYQLSSQHKPVIPVVTKRNLLIKSRFSPIRLPRGASPPVKTFAPSVGPTQAATQMGISQKPQLLGLVFDPRLRCYHLQRA